MPGETHPACPSCGKSLSPVTQSATSPLNRYQFDAVKAGDWYCKCHDNGRGNQKLAYYWDKEVNDPPVPYKQQREVCWFIERRADPCWLAGFDYDKPVWTNDPLAAIGFERREDAAALCKPFGLFDGIGEAAQGPFPSEHMFFAPPPQTQAAVQWYPVEVRELIDVTRTLRRVTTSLAFALEENARAAGEEQDRELVLAAKVVIKDTTTALARFDPAPKGDADAK